jgi:hypothetical protein
MTREEFTSLKLNDEITYEGNEYKVVNVYPMQRIIMAKGILNVTIPFRYEDVELVVKDALLEYLIKITAASDTHTDEQIADNIRSIVRKEVIDGLKLPTYEDLRVKCNPYITQSFFDWFVEETKRLNS